MLTTLSTVKARIGIAAADVKDDDLLTLLIGQVSARFENEANRVFGYASEQEEFQGDETELRVRRYPIDTQVALLFELKSDEATGWVAQTAMSYVVRKGCVISLRCRIGTENDVLRVTYSGGFVLPVDATDSDPAVAGNLPQDLQTQATEQVVFLYQNKDRVGITQMSSQGGSISLAGVDLLPSARAVVAKYERWMA